jgi:hypothetical protein
LHLKSDLCVYIFAFKLNLRRYAAAHFTAALTADPFLWSSYEELCALGAETEVGLCTLNQVDP